MRLKKSFWIVFTFFLLLPCFSWSQKIKVLSDKMEVYENQGLVVFTGHVKAVKGDLTVWADKLYVYYKNKNGKRDIKKLVALGNVVIKKDGWRSYSGKAIYFKPEEKLILEEEPKVWHGKDLIEGDVVVVYFKEGRSEVLARGEGRVKVNVYSE
jgi:lipopolysaccharide export system protein LptA